MQRSLDAVTRVQVQSFTYDHAHEAYRLRGWIASTRMDAHVAMMLSKGWKILNAAQHPGAPRGSITLIFGKAYERHDTA